MTAHVTLPNALSAADCDRLIALAQTAQMKDAGLVRQTTAHQIRRAEIAWLDDLPQGGWAMDQMIAHVAQANRGTHTPMLELTPVLQGALYGLFVVAIVLFSGGETVPFIYFQF